MGVVTKSIGTTGRNYSTIQAWEDALPANLVTDGNSQVGELYNDSEFSSASSLLTISGETTSSAFTITLKCAAGQSFRDHASKSTNRLAYNRSNGVGIKLTGSYAAAIAVQVPNVTIDGIQVISTGSPSQGILITGASTTNVTVKNSILQAKPGATQYVADANPGGGACLFSNCLIINAGTTGGGARVASASKAVNCTVVRPSNIAAAGTAMVSIYGTATAKNCAIFGFSTGSSGTFAADGHNCTDLASAPGSTSNLTSKTYANQFEQTSNASSVEDFRQKAAADLKDAGVTDTTNVPASDDIIGTARSSWDIGAWEFGSSTQSFSYTPSGGLTFAGAAATVRTQTRLVSGGITLSGTSAQTRGRTVTPSGGLTFGGTVAMFRGVVRSITGGLLFSGTAPVSFQSFIQSLTVTPVGGLVLSGSAAVVRACSRVVSGGISFAGHASVVFNDVATAIGNWKRGLQSRRNKRNNNTFTKRR